MHSPDAIRQAAAALGPWFQNLDLHGVPTAPDHFLGDYPSVKWAHIAGGIPADLTGKSVLDIGCNAGFYSIEMKRRGAARVLGVDTDERYLAQARFAAATLGLDIEYRAGSVYQVADLRERFDLVIFMGVLYHLRHPLLALDLIRAHAARDLLLFQTLRRGDVNQPKPVPSDAPFENTSHFARPGYPAMYFIEKSYSGDPTNWWIPNRACAEALLRSAGFNILSQPEEETYLCRVGLQPEGALP